MNCPNCGKTIKKNYCMFCGYMLDTGNFIDKNKKGEVTPLETYLGYNYDKIVRNKNWISTLLLGPLYIAVKGFMIQGGLLFLFDFFLFYLFFTLNNYFPLPGLYLILDFLLILTNRIIWMTIDNMIYVKLLENKLNIIKESNPDNYKEIIDNMSKSHKDIYSLIIVIGLLILIPTIIMSIYVLTK